MPRRRWAISKRPAHRLFRTTACPASRWAWACARRPANWRRSSPRGQGCASIRSRVERTARERARGEVVPEGSLARDAVGEPPLVHVREVLSVVRLLRAARCARSTATGRACPPRARAGGPPPRGRAAARGRRRARKPSGSPRWARRRRCAREAMLVTWVLPRSKGTRSGSWWASAVRRRSRGVTDMGRTSRARESYTRRAPG